MSSGPCPKREPAPRWRAVRPEAPSPLPDRLARARNRPLRQVARQLGYRRDPRNRQRWRRPGSVLAIRGARFFDHRRGRGGGGAIDLVLHARGCSFRQALAFLDALPPTPAHAPPAQPRSDRALSLPPPCHARWPPVRHYLARSRRLDPRLLDQCRQLGVLWADARQNAVFLCRDLQQQPAGAELNGSRPSPSGATFKGLAPGSRKQRGGFWIAPQAPRSYTPPHCVLLCESAVDALSAALLQLPQLPPRTLFASAAGLAHSIPAWLHSIPPHQLLCGFDNDPPGQLAAQRLLQRHPKARRLPPAGAKDWNQLLLLRSC